MRLLLLFALGAFFALPTVIHAEGKEEQRVYSVTADGKPAGLFKVVIEEKEDDLVTARFAAMVNVKKSFKDYKYLLKGLEVWQKDHLIRMETETEDDGKKMQLKVEKDKEGLILTNDEKKGLLKADAWTTSYWHMPAEGKRVLIDADTGKVLDSKWEKVGVEVLNLIGQRVNCTHWRVTGTAKAELWFDGSNRLVRQEIVESGVKLVTELTEFKK